MRIRLPNNWEPRPYQRKLWSYLEGGGKRADIAAHRRWGKDDVSLHWEAIAAHQRVGTYWHMLPEASQARKAIWDAINPHTGKRRIDEAFPPALRETTRNDEMFIRFKCGSSWQVVGSDNYNSLVGSPPLGVVFSEWSLAKPDAWTYMRPILAENGGWAIFIWTPRGRNHATRAFEAREVDPTWFTLRSAATDTGVFTAEQLAKERADLISELGSEEEGDAKYRQEYLVDFDAAVPGSYYGAQMGAAKNEGRVGSFPYDPALPVSTAWDIGVDDYTAIWFLQENGKQVRAVDYFETSGEGAEAIVDQAIKGKPYKWGQHYLPHDVMVREWGHGAKTRFQTLRELGVGPIRVGVAADPADRINAARKLLPIVSFDIKAAAGADRLRNYRKRWNTGLMAYTGPLHDENSHGADAFGEYAINCPIRPEAIKPPSRNPKDLWGRNTDGEDSWRA